MAKLTIDQPIHFSTIKDGLFSGTIFNFTNMAIDIYVPSENAFYAHIKVVSNNRKSPAKTGEDRFIPLNCVYTSKDDIPLDLLEFYKDKNYII